MSSGSNGGVGPAVPGPAHARAFPTSFGQERLWLIQQLHGTSEPYHLFRGFSLRGPLAVPALERALGEIVRRHEALRTTFREDDGGVVQVIAPFDGFALPIEDVSGSDDTQRRLDMHRRAEEEAARPFDLVDGPLLRVRLLRLGSEEHVLFLCMHHIISDGWSLGVMLRELSALYAAYRAGEESPLAEPTVRYRDHAVWSRRRLRSSEALELQLVYWKRRLAGVPDLIELPTDRRRPPVQTYRGCQWPLRLPAELLTRLKALAKSEGVTLFMVLLGAFKVLLSTYGRTEDVLVGIPVAGRTRKELEDVVGFFVNTLPARTDLGGDPSIREVLRRVRETTLGALNNQDVPFERLVAELRPERSPAHSPLVQVMFALQNARAGALALTGLEIEPLRIVGGASKFDLTLSVEEAPEGLIGTVEYCSDLFEAESVERLVGHWKRLLEEMAADPERRVSELELVGEEERRRVLEEWNAGGAVEAGGPCVHEQFEAWAARTPGAVAVVCGEEEVTYRELNERANRLTHYLRERGVGPEVRVGLCLDRGVEYVVAMVAVSKAGGAYVPLDPGYPADRLAYMLADAGVAVLVTERKHLDVLRGRGAAEVVCVDAQRAEIEREREGDPESGVRRGNLAYLIYTSGSTGRPKAVAIEHGGVANLCAWHRRAFGITGADRATQLASVGFDASVWEVWPYLTAGARVEVVPEELRYDAGRLRDWLVEHGSTVAFVPTPMAQPLLELEWPEGTALRWLLTGGDRLQGRPGAGIPFEVGNNYGPTEGTVVSTSGKVEREGARAPSIGRPIDGTRVYVLSEAMQPQPVGVPGELYIGGAQVARGYLGRPGLTAEQFVPDPFGGEAGGRLYRTGDLVRFLPDGAIEYRGRVDEQVKIRGFRIEPGEIEAVLRQHEHVEECVTVVHGEGATRRLVAYFVPSGEEHGSGALPETLRDFASRELPEYMVPSAFVAVESIPLTPHGKVDRRALPEPEARRAGSGAADAAPRSELERVIAEAWERMLGIDRPGVRSNFFDVGGNSLLLVQLRGELRRTLGLDIPTVDLFRFPTIAALARHLAGAEEPGAVAGRSGTEDGTRRPRGASDIAIIGTAARFPGAANVDEFWSNVRDGVESITRFTAPEHLPDQVGARGVLPGADLFDADFFGFTAREAEVLDPQHRLFLESAWEALESAGYGSGRRRGRVGVFAGTGASRYLIEHLIPSRTELELLGEFQASVLNDKDFLPTQVAYRLDLRGPGVAVQTACSTSLVAVHLACRSLAGDECDMALAGGVTIVPDQEAGYRYVDGGVLSPDGRCRAFDARAAGAVPGSGVGTVLLKRLENALADGDTVHAVIRGSAINNDGARKVGYTAPSIDGQARVIEDAQRIAGVSPDTITYVEAHGTGTALGDPIEVAALKQAFRRGTERVGYCGLGSVKTNVGHLDAAAGIAGLIKTVCALKHGVLPPSLHFRESNPEIEFADSPFFVVTEAREWPADARPRRAGVSSFGIGGTNAHVVLEEAPPVAARATTGPTPMTGPAATITEPAAVAEPADAGDPAPGTATAPVTTGPAPQLLVLSAKTPTALQTTRQNLARHLEQHRALDLADVAYTLQVGRSEFAHRTAVVCRGGEEAVAALRGSGETLRGWWEEADRPVAFQFPGQGAQHVGMGRGLYATEPVFRAELDRCARELETHLGTDLRDALYGSESPDAEAALAQTALAQPALFAVEYALARLWMSFGVEPEAMIGHSVGEYVAACLAGVFSLEDALRLVAARGRLIQSLAPGAMLAVELPAGEVEERLDGSVSLAAVNAPSLSVVSGPTEAVEALRRRLEADGIEVHRLRTSHAFHSAMMDPVRSAWAEEVARVERAAPRIPFISSLTGTWITAEEATDPDYWSRQLREPVRFADGAGELLEDPRRLLLEVGPGRTLSRLVRQQGKTDRGRVVASMRHPNEKADDRRVLLESEGRLWVAGGPIDWGRVNRERRRRVPLPTYPFERRRYWVDAPSTVATAAPTAATPAREAAGGPVPKVPDPREWFYIPSWRRSLPPPTRAASTGGPSLVFTDGNVVGRELTERLEAEGRTVLTVAIGERYARVADGAFMVRPAEAGDYGRLLREIAGAGPIPSTIVHLWNLRPGAEAIARVHAFAAAQERGYYSLVALAQAFAAEAPGAETRWFVVAEGLHAVESVDRPRPERATLLGPCKVIPQEYPNIVCSSVDVVLPHGDSAATLVEQLLAEIRGAPTDPTIAYRGAQRWVRSFERVRLEDRGSVGLREGGVYLITGGLGTVGRLLAEHLARQVRARLVLTGRRRFPPREQWQPLLEESAGDAETIAAIRTLLTVEEHGGQVEVVQADVADEREMRRVFERVERRFGTLNGVIHAAAITWGDSAAPPVARLGHDASEAHFRPKAHGLYVLDSLLDGRDLDFCLLFSSLNAVLGGRGSTAYTAANLFLDACAEARNGTVGAPWIAVDWDAWPTAERARAAAWSPAGAGLKMTPEEALEAFGRVLCHGMSGRIVVSTGDLARRVERSTRPETFADSHQAAAGDVPLERRAAYAAPRDAVEQAVAEVWQQLFGLERVGIHDNFFELGGHSLLGTRLMSHLRRIFGVDLPLRTLFSGPTVAEVAAAVRSHELDRVDPGALAQALAEVERMSAQDLQEELRRSGPPLAEGGPR